jgi:anion-transporting  ArsA/GET3 family ATPase
VRQLLNRSSIVIVLGVGGVGKTTISAAMGLAAAQSGSPTGIITADPSRRLRDALGIERLSSRLRRLDSRRLRAAGLDPHLQLAAMALETQAVWDGLVERLVPTAEARQRILANSFYRNLTRRYPGSDSAAALAELIELRADPRFALHIVDTPPSGHAFDLIEGPANLARLLDSESVHWLFDWAKFGSRMSIANRIASIVVDQLERFAGVQPLIAIADFFSNAADFTSAIVQRLRDAETLLRAPSTSLVLVTTAEPERLREAMAMADDLRAAKLHVAGVIINRVADDRTCAALRTDPHRVPAHLHNLERPAKDHRTKGATEGEANLIAFLRDYAVMQQSALLRVSDFVDNFADDVEVVLIPQLNPTRDDLQALARIGDLIMKATYGRQLLREARPTLARLDKTAASARDDPLGPE